MTPTTGSRAHVVFLPADVATAELRSLSEVLTAEEREAAARFRRDADRRRFVVARGALRTLLGRHESADPRSLVFDLGPNGKPRLRGSSLHFNVAHSGRAVALAFADGEIGVDVEEKTPLDPVEVSRTVFAPAEIERLLAAEDRMDAFFATWTAKEAVVKAAGGGLSMALRAFVVPDSPETLRPIALLAPDPALEGWCVWRLRAPEGHAAALALRGVAWEVTVTNAQGPSNLRALG